MGAPLDAKADAEAYARAQRRVRAKIGFLKHVGVYLGVGLLLLGISRVSGREFAGMRWPLLGWGAAVLVHFIAVFGFGRRRPDAWRERMREREERRSAGR